MPFPEVLSAVNIACIITRVVTEVDLADCELIAYFFEHAQSGYFRLLADQHKAETTESP